MDKSYIYGFLTFCYHTIPLLLVWYINKVKKVQRRLYLFLWYSFGYIISMFFVGLINILLNNFCNENMRILNNTEFLIFVIYTGILYFPLLFYPFWIYAIYRLIKEFVIKKMKK